MLHASESTDLERLEYAYQYLMENNIPPSAKHFEYLAQSIVYVADHPTITLDSCIRTVALKNNENSDRLKAGMKYTAKTSAGTTVKQLVFDAATSVRLALLRKNNMDYQRSAVS